MWKHFKTFSSQKVNISTQTIVKEELRVYCQHSGCNVSYKHKIGGSTRNMCTHLKKHKIYGEEEEKREDNTDKSEQQKAATFDQVTRILYLMVMFIITAGLSFRTVQNKFFKLLITEFFQVKFPWQGRKKIRKLVHKYVEEK